MADNNTDTRADWEILGGLARRLDIILGRIGSFGRYLGIISIHRHVGLRCLS